MSDSSNNLIPCLSSPNKSPLFVYVDGSCFPTNPGHAGYGIVASIYRKEPYIPCFTRSGGIGWATNNVAELTAIYATLLLFIRAAEKGRVIKILSDSRYAVNVSVGKWCPVKNQKLVQKIKTTIAKFSKGKLTISWIPREENLADAYAKRGATMGLRTTE